MSAGSHNGPILLSLLIKMKIVTIDETKHARVSNLMDSTSKAQQIKMEKDSKIFHRMQKLTTFTEEKYKSDLVPRKANYETLRTEKNYY